MNERGGTPQWGRFNRKASRKDNEGTDKPPRPRFKVRQAQAPAGGGRFVLTTLLVVAVLAGLVLAVQFYRASRPDPHYTAAVKMVEAFEQGKTPDRINYGHEVYDTALERLAQVNPKSVSAPDAQTLDRTIRERVAAFHARLREEARRTEEIVLARREKEAIIYERLRESRAQTPRYYPECGEGPDDHGGHSHSH